MGLQPEFPQPLEGAYLLWNGRRYQRTSAVVFSLMASWSLATIVRYLPPPYTQRRLLIVALCALTVLWDVFAVRSVLSDKRLHRTAEYTRAIAFVVNSSLAMVLVILCKAQELPLMDVPLFHVVLNAIMIWTLHFRGVTAQRLQLVMIPFSFFMMCSQWLLGSYRPVRFTVEMGISLAVAQISLVANAWRDRQERQLFMQTPGIMAALERCRAARAGRMVEKPAAQDGTLGPDVGAGPLNCQTEALKQRPVLADASSRTSGGTEPLFQQCSAVPVAAS